MAVSQLQGILVRRRRWAALLLLLLLLLLVLVWCGSRMQMQYSPSRPSLLCYNRHYRPHKPHQSTVNYGLHSRRVNQSHLSPYRSDVSILVSSPASNVILCYIHA